MTGCGVGHMPYSRIERMILKGLYNGYSFDMSLLKQLVNVSVIYV